MRLRNLRGRCPSFTLKPVSLRLPKNAIYKLVNRGNTNGDAAVGLVLSVVSESTNAIGLFKRRKVAPLTGTSVNIILNNRNVPAYLAAPRIKGIVTNVCAG